MPKCLFERSTGLFEGGTRWDDIPHDTGTHIQLTLADYPDRRTQRWDGAMGVRAATGQEIADFDDAASTTAANTDIDTLRALKAVVIWVAPLVGKTPAQARAEIIDLYKTL